jgi:hypothetical protein
MRAKRRELRVSGEDLAAQADDQGLTFEGVRRDIARGAAPEKSPAHEPRSAPDDAVLEDEAQFVRYGGARFPGAPSQPKMTVPVEFA